MRSRRLRRAIAWLNRSSEDVVNGAAAQGVFYCGEGGVVFAFFSKSFAELCKNLLRMSN